MLMGHRLYCFCVVESGQCITQTVKKCSIAFYSVGRIKTYWLFKVITSSVYRFLSGTFPYLLRYLFKKSYKTHSSLDYSVFNEIKCVSKSVFLEISLHMNLHLLKWLKNVTLINDIVPQCKYTLKTVFYRIPLILCIKASFI